MLTTILTSGALLVSAGCMVVALRAVKTAREAEQAAYYALGRIRTLQDRRPAAAAAEPERPLPVHPEAGTVVLPEPEAGDDSIDDFPDFAPTVLVNPDDVPSEIRLLR